MPQLGHFLIPNPWQSKHFHLSKMLPFFLFLPVPLQPSHSTAPFPLQVLQPAETSFAPDFDAMTGCIILTLGVGVDWYRHENLRFTAVEVVRETRLAASISDCLFNLQKIPVLCNAGGNCAQSGKKIDS